MFGRNWLGLAVVGLLVGCDNEEVIAPPQPDPLPEATVYSASGDITVTVEAFRAALGPSNGGTAGEQPAGRREIGWDGAVSIPFNNRDDFPAVFFNTAVKAGALFTTSGTGFRNDSTRFKEVNAAYAEEFNPFSPDVLFAPVGSNQFDQVFQVAGLPTPAVVNAFGIVLSDVDVADKTTIELFAQDGTSLGTFTSPVRTDEAGLTFIGVTFEEAIIARVRVTLGTGALGADVDDISAGGTLDLVVLDNLIYGEPRPAF